MKLASLNEIVLNKEEKVNAIHFKNCTIKNSEITVDTFIGCMFGNCKFQNCKFIDFSTFDNNIIKKVSFANCQIFKYELKGIHNLYFMHTQSFKIYKAGNIIQFEGWIKTVEEWWVEAHKEDIWWKKDSKIKEILDNWNCEIVHFMFGW